ncbi:MULTISPECIES: glycosyltransferase [Halobacterium]|uniref:glycosyltransferase n=1 Tax=Halobacterium TaxID=2239 RepID=UPI0009E6A18A|nr:MULTISPECIES: glycosyltransferase [Halobacterium]MCG1003031.1 glycosyltransferase [Halobacterium noricense]
MPRVSVVIPTCNDEDTIERTLESLKSQRYQGFEVIVVDDGNDETADIVRESPYRIIDRDSTGIASALNRGIQEAQGTYIARQDADDTSHPDRLRKQVAFLDEHEDIGVLGTGAYIVENENVRARRRVLKRVPQSAFFDKNHMIHGSVMMRRNALEEVGLYDERLDYIEDLDLWVRMSDEFVVANIDEPLYNFTMHGESIYGERLKDVLLLHKFVEKRENGLPEDVERSVYNGNPEAISAYLDKSEIADLYRTMAIENLRYGRLKEARKTLGQCMKKNIEIIDIPLLVLSLTTSSITKRVADLYRKFLNWKINRQNQKMEIGMESSTH